MSSFLFQVLTAEERSALFGLLGHAEPLTAARNELYLKIKEYLERLSGPEWAKIWRVEQEGAHCIRVFKWAKPVMAIEPFYNSAAQVAYQVNSPVMDEHEVKFKLAAEKLGTRRTTDSVEGVLSAVRWGGHWTPVPRKSKKTDKKQVYMAQLAQAIDLRE